ncbi:hypothetical protein [Horticoccus sp. 23ND18S-11]|uniref:hypothetical protein n=1 Tax=Horticoccus sp. 23ND18S-11 TaxID=3391832 RepID=UPI0039C97A61
MFRSTLAVLAVIAATVTAQAQGLQGKVEGKVYISPTGLFKVVIPVLPELGGDITDTPNVVTFQDDFNVHVSIAAFPQDATQRWEMSTRGLKDYLIYFFSNFVLSDFRQTFEGVQIESAKFVPGTLEGSLLTYLMVPGGTMFADRVPQLSGTRVPVAKRGNLLFVRSGHIFVISTELAERVIEGKSYSKTTAEEDEILRNRLLDIVSKISFAKLPATESAKK